MIVKLLPTGVFGLRILAVRRNKEFTPQYCPFQQEFPPETEKLPHHAQCGEWCPLFEVNPTDVQLKCAPKLVLFDLEVDK